MKPGTVAVGFLDAGQWSACFGQSLIELYLVDATGPRRMVPNGKQIRNQCGTGGIVAGRNETAATFLDATECEWLFMIDTDMGFGPDTVERLIAAADPTERPVVGGLTFKLDSLGRGPYNSARFAILPCAFTAYESADQLGFAPIRDLPADDLVRVDATGAACLLVHRSALEQVREVHGDHWFDPITFAGSDAYHGPPKTFSEDLSFCVRLIGAGIPIHVHTGVGTTHDKGGIFLDRETFEAELPAPVVA